MKVTHRVKDSQHNTIGFLVDGKFCADYVVKENIEYIDGVTLRKNGRIRTEEELPEIGYREAVNGQLYQKIVSENPFERNIQKEFTQWKNDRLHTVMQLEGSRQTGKTTELLKFAYKNYEYVIYVNLSEDVFLFEQVAGGGFILLEMEKYCRRARLPHYVDDRNTILIIDEIQNSKKIYNSIRRLHSELACDIIVTGSYLGRILGDRGFFLPAGTISYSYMFTLSFGEFCRIFQCEELLKTIDLFGKGDARDYKKLEDLYRLYVKIGGYPEVVKKYVETENTDHCYFIIRKLLNTFKEESRNYFQSDREVEIFDQVYREALKEMCNEKRGTGNHLIEKITTLTSKDTSLLVNRKEVTQAVVWLKYAGILGVCNLANEGDMRDIKPDRRMYFSDCGIASYLAANSLIAESSLSSLLTETFVYNELHRLFKVEYTSKKVIDEEVCFSIYGNYELDFMLADKNKTVYGIEVKAAAGTPVSLKVFIDKHFADRGVVARPAKRGHGEIFDTIPVYTVGYRFPYKKEGYSPDPGSSHYAEE